MTSYPNRPAFFAQRVIRLFVKTCAMQSLGADAFALFCVIATQEDAKRYKGAVTFFNEPLMSLLGIRKWDTLDSLRRRLVEAGWLHYDPPPTGARRQAGSYWTLIPDGIDDLPDTAVDEGDPIEAAYRRGYADAKAGRPCQPYPLDGDGQSKAYPPNGYSDTEAYPRNGDGRGDGRGEPSYPSPIPFPSNTRPEPVPAPPRSAPPKSKKAKPTPSFTPEDHTVASEMWQGILAIQPGRSPPDLDKWANEIRLMRESDRRTHAEIRGLVQRVQADPFWSVNILSPAKLREKWDDLQLRLSRNNGSKASPSRVHTPGRYDGLDRRAYVE